jgi:predicted DNA-binding transcriptional regulator AlpA
MQFAKMPAVSKKTAEPPSTIYWRVSNGEFVPPIKQGERAAAFILEEVDAVMRARAAGATRDEIKTLVRELVAARKIDAAVVSNIATEVRSADQAAP